MVGIIALALVLGAQAYLVATSWTGARSGERPAAAWRWAAIGWGAIFAAELIVDLVSVVSALAPPSDLAGSEPYMRAFEVGGWVSTIRVGRRDRRRSCLACRALAAGEIEDDADDVAARPAAEPPPTDDWPGRPSEAG